MKYSKNNILLSVLIKKNFLIWNLIQLFTNSCANKFKMNQIFPLFYVIAIIVLIAREKSNNNQTAFRELSFISFAELNL